MNIKDIKLKKGMAKEKVNELISEWMLLEDDIYMGCEYKHRWKCKCGEVINKRTWGNIKGKHQILCEKCRLGIKNSYDSISEVVLKINMNKDEVNKLTSKWIKLDEDVYLGTKYKHKWMCSCGNQIVRSWDNIRVNNAIKCSSCISGKDINNGKFENISLKKGMSNSKVNKLIGEYVYFEDDIFNGVAFKHNWKCRCGNTFTRRWNCMLKNHNVDCGCKEYNKQEQRYKNEVEKTGQYEYIRSFRKGDILPNGKTVNHCSYIQIKHKYCGNIYEVSSGGFINSQNKCSFCCGSYENSFAHHIEVELGEPLEKYWDFEKNTLNPYHIYKNSRNKVWIKCQNKDYHGSYDAFCYSFVKSDGGLCSYCQNRKVHYLDSFGSLHPDKINIWSNKNDKTPYEVAPCSASRFLFECDICGHVWDSMLSNISYGYGCPSCSSSKGEKFIKLILENINISYIHDKPYFRDLLGIGGNPLRPDFILPEHKIWIEYDGEFHYSKIYDNDNYETLKEHDKRKDEYAKKHGWKMIRIPYWEFDNIENILEKELNL